MSQSLHVSNLLPLSIRIVVALSLRLPYSSMGAVGVKIGIQPELPRLLHEGTMSAKAESMAWAGTPCHAWYTGAAGLLCGNCVKASWGKDGAQSRS